MKPYPGGIEELNGDMERAIYAATFGAEFVRVPELGSSGYGSSDKWRAACKAADAVRAFREMMGD